MCIHIEHTSDKPADPRKHLRDAIDEAVLYLDLHGADAHALRDALPHAPAFNAVAPVLQQLLSALLAVVPKAQLTSSQPRA